MSPSLFRFALLLSMTAGVGTAQVRMVQLDEVARETTLRNFSSTATVNISGYFLCREPNTYRQLSNLPIVQGDLNLSPGEEVTIEYSFIPLAGGVGLYSTVANFNDPNNMTDYVQYGGVVGFRQPVGVAAGFWTAGTFVDGASGPFVYNGDGVNDNGSEFWSVENGAVFCNGNVNSSGQVATLGLMGSAAAAPLDLAVEVTGLPAAPNFGLLFFGPNQIPPVALGEGFLCVGGGIVRVTPTAQAAGSTVITLDGSAPYAATIVAGSTQNFQYWFRDPVPGGAGFNFSDGISVSFQ